MNVKLPESYCKKMKDLLKEEYDAYIASFDIPSYTCIRINTSKISVEDFKKISPVPLRPVSWCKEAFYVEHKEEVSRHPYYYAGLYYIQEPSATLPAEVLPVKKGDRVLDLCAAPGGKTTRLATKLNHEGLLVANDISFSRCQTLVKNLEKFGIDNSIVTSEEPTSLAKRFPSYFDCILVDAPCSGEGMFRKEHELIRAYEKHDSSWYVPIQKQIAEEAVKMLKPGGTMVYSTCTFSKEEDEDIVSYILSLSSDMHVLPVPYCEGFIQNELGTHLYPHRIQGEGHFVSLLKKEGEHVASSVNEKQFSFDFDTISFHNRGSVFYEKKEYVYALPEMDVNLEGIRMVRSGLLLGEKKKGRFVPSVSLALAMQEEECKNVLNLSVTDDRVIRYLKGETLDIRDQNLSDGYALVAVDGYPLGFATVKNGQFKNRYPKAWVYR